MDKAHHIRKKAQANRDTFPIIWEKNTLKLYFLFSGKRELPESKNLLLNICKFLSFTSTFLEVSIISSESHQEESSGSLCRLKKLDKRLSDLIFLAASLAAPLIERKFIIPIISMTLVAVFFGVRLFLLKAGIFSIIIIFVSSSTKSATMSFLFISALFSLYIMLIIAQIIGVLIGTTLAIGVARSISSESWEMKWFSRPLAYLIPKDDREEWLGDLVEARHELLKAGYPRWIASLITVAKSGLLVWSLIRIRYQDLVSPSVRKKQD